MMKLPLNQTGNVEITLTAISNRLSLVQKLPLRGVPENTLKRQNTDEGERLRSMGNL